MKLHTGSCEIKYNQDLVNAIVDALKEKPRPRVVIETGTFHGTGSTRMLINAVEQFFKEYPKSWEIDLYTIEIDEANYLVAKNNLKEYPWIHVVHGCSVDAEEAREFIKNDKAILEHDKYPDYFIDSLDDPVGFYLEEIRGKRFNHGNGQRNGILLRLIPEIYKKRPLFLLDSAGGIGYLEFQTVVKHMDNHRYFVLLDDIGHLKHFRSAAYIRQCEWPILYENERCMLALHPGYGGKPKKVK